MQWRQIEKEIVILVENSGTWPDIAGIREEESELWIAEDQNMDRNGEERKITDNRTI